MAKSIVNVSGSEQTLVNNPRSGNFDISLGRGIEGHTLCTICSNEFRVPKLLKCFHSFCECCLQDYIGRHGQQGRFRCPVCHSDMELPPNGTEGFATNMFLGSSKTETATVCDVCDEKRLANSKCADCRQNYCSVCVAMHTKIPALKNHSILTIANSGVAVQFNSGLCNKHSSEQVRYFCQECSEFICATCKRGQHSNHVSPEIHAIAGEIRRNLKMSLDSRTEELNTDKQKKQMDDMNTHILKLSSSVTDVITNIQNHTQKIHDEIDRISQRTIQKVHECHRDQTQKTNEEKAILMKAINSRSAMLLTAQNMVKMADDIEIVRIGRDLESRLTQKDAQELLRSRKSTDILFKPGTVSIKDLEYMIGVLDFSTGTPPSSDNVQVHIKPVDPSFKRMLEATLQTKHPGGSIKASSMHTNKYATELNTKPGSFGENMESSRDMDQTSPLFTNQTNKTKVRFQTNDTSVRDLAANFEKARFERSRSLPLASEIEVVPDVIAIKRQSHFENKRNGDVTPISKFKQDTIQQSTTQYVNQNLNRDAAFQKKSLTKLSIELLNNFPAPFTSTVYSVAPLPNGNCLLTENGGKSVYVVDYSGRIVRTIYFGGKVDDLAVDKLCQCYVSCPDQKCIKIISTTMEIKHFVTTTLFPRGLAVTDQNEVIVCLNESARFSEAKKGHRNGIMKYSVDGSPLVFIEEDNHRQRLFGYPVRVAIRGDGSIFVTDKLRCNVVSLTTNNSPKIVFTCISEERFVHGICCDKFGRVILADGHLHCLDSSDQPIQIVLDEKRRLHSTNSLGLDHQGNLWVGCNQGQIYVCKCAAI